MLATAVGILLGLLLLAAAVALTMDFVPLWAVEGMVLFLLAGFAYV